MCEPQNQGLILSGWEAVENELYHLGPLKYKRNFAKEEELGIVVQEGGGRQAGLEPSPVVWKSIGVFRKLPAG